MKISDKDQLLQKLKSVPLDTDDYSEYFREVADLLMSKYIISKRDVKYEIIEIEFYLYNKNHKDIITYPRKLDAGEWFFHQSGVDLTFNSNANQFGGILIRGLREIEGARNQIFGPCKCVDVLWDKFNAFEVQCSDIPVIIPANGKVEMAPLTAYQRWIPVKNGDNVKNKILKWIKRIKDEGYVIENENTSDEEINKISSLIFNSEYRFLKEKSIDQADKAWKNYKSRPKTI